MNSNDFFEFQNYETFQTYNNQIMNIYSLLQKYLLNLIEINKDYEKKLINLNQKFNFKSLLSNNSNQLKTVNNISLKIYNLIDDNIEGIKMLNDFLDNNYSTGEIYLFENNQNIKNFNKEYLNIKEEFENKFKEINKSKNIFFNSITNYKNYLEKKILNNSFKLKLSKNEEDEDEKKFIKILKISEKDYENKIKNFKLYEETFKSDYNKNIDHLKSNLKEILDSLKNYIVDALVLLKNYYQIPYFQIESDLKKINEFKISENFLNEISNKINNKKDKNEIIKIDFENYLINFSDENKNNYFNAIESEKEKYKTDIKDLYLIVNKIAKQTKYLNLNNYNLKNEKLKINTINLSEKILNFSKEKNSISKEDFNTLLNNFEYSESRKMFLKKLNEFRNLGIFSLPKKVFNQIGIILNKILDFSLKDNDLFCFKNCIILSQTFYKENDKNCFLIKRISKHKIFKNKQIWENYLEYIIQKEIIDTLQNNKKNYGNFIEEDQKENIKKYGKIVFAQLLGLCDNMIDFNFDKEEIKKLIKPKIEFYQMEQEDALIIYDVLETKQPNKYEFNDSENEEIFPEKENLDFDIIKNKKKEEVNNDNNKNENDLSKKEEKTNEIKNNDELLINNQKEEDKKDFDNKINDNNSNNVINEENNIKNNDNELNNSDNI